MYSTTLIIPLFLSSLDLIFKLGMRNLPSPLCQDPYYNIFDLPLLVEGLEKRLANFGIDYEKIVIDKQTGNIYVITRHAEGVLEPEILNKIMRDLYNRSSKEVK